MGRLQIETTLAVLGDARRCRNQMPRIFLTFLVLLLGGCQRTVVEREAVFSADGQSRLVLRYNTRDQKRFDFNDLVLEAQTENGWTRDSIIWKGDADVAMGITRWVSSLDSLDDDCKSAVIQVATMGPPDATGTSTVEYSWVRWDLIANSMLKTLHVCESPFDALPHEKR